MLAMWTMCIMHFVVHLIRGRKRLIEAIGCCGTRYRDPEQGKVDKVAEDLVDSGTLLTPSGRGAESPTTLVDLVERPSGVDGASVDPSTG